MKTYDTGTLENKMNYAAPNRAFTRAVLSTIKYEL